MDVFVLGATGELGRPAVRDMISAGHRVRAVTRTDAKAALLGDMGADPVVLQDVFDRDALARAASGADALLHLATRIPPTREMRKPAAWAENNRLRSDLTPLLVDVALEREIGVLVAESITFVYPDCGSDWIDEATPLATENLPLQSVLDLEREVERFRAAGGSGVTLRFSSFYGPTAESTEAALHYARRRVAPVLGAADTYQSSIQTDDAGTAVAAALEAASGTYNVSDDEPLTRREFADAFAAAFGLPHLRVVPPTLARLITGKTATTAGRSQRVRNDRFKYASGWAPRYTTARDGWVAAAAARVEEGANA
jgi:nucleoside-diphosphate-sugar epimerase